jgi:hypothetical protein
MRGFFEIVPDADYHRTLRLLHRREWARRQSYTMARLVHQTATEVKELVSERIPTKDDYATYASSMEVVKVAGVRPEEGVAYAIRVKPKARRVRQVDSKKVVLYIRPRRRLARVPPQIEVLEKYNPWTLDTLPFMPKKREALVIMRRVNGREVTKIGEQRKRDKPQWRKELTRVGAPPAKAAHKPKLGRHTKALPDVAFEALRLEFGLGVQPRPHWRPALHQFLPGGFRSMLRKMPGLQAALTNPKFSGWRKGPPKTRNRIRVQDAMSFVPFERKLNVRF